MPLPGAKAGVQAVKRGAKVAAGSAGLSQGPKSLASRVDMFDPPPQPPRPFEADYPDGAVADESGRLLRDIGGRAIRAPTIVGRQVLGGPDVPLSQDAYAAVIKAITGRDIQRVQARRLDGALGGTRVDEAGKPVRVDILDSLSENEYWTTVRHEFGHVIDQAAGQIHTAGLEDELRLIYGSLQRVPESPSLEITPENLGYSAREVPRELVAEAIRAYAMDPNYIKTVAPKVAEGIRRWVSASPLLSKTLHFNSIAAGLVAGAAVAGALRGEAEARER